VLSSLNYGEKWGRHWLDLVRYSETGGFELDAYIHDAWRYRDWVIQRSTTTSPMTGSSRSRSGDELFPEDPVAHTGTRASLVNPIWQYHFGRVLVATTSDLGTRGGKPTHPELLDWLASQFLANGWSIKHMHRVITA
jgi:hypothetical protein